MVKLKDMGRNRYSCAILGLDLWWSVFMFLLNSINDYIGWYEVIMSMYACMESYYKDF